VFFKALFFSLSSDVRHGAARRAGRIIGYLVSAPTNTARRLVGRRRPPSPLFFLFLSLIESNIEAI